MTQAYSTHVITPVYLWLKCVMDTQTAETGAMRDTVVRTSLYCRSHQSVKLFKFPERFLIQISGSCSFEAPCSWQHVPSSGAWLVQSGTTPSRHYRTGPNADHTTGTGQRREKNPKNPTLPWVAILGLGFLGLFWFY